jgi:hypothetical protein
MEVSDELHAPAALPGGKPSDAHWIGACVEFIIGLEAMEKKKILLLQGI